MPSSALVNTDGTYNFAAIGGTPPYDFQLQSGVGAVTVVNATTARYDAPAAETTEAEVVRLTDAEGTIRLAKVNVLAPQVLTLNPPSITLQVGGSYGFYALGGRPPYAYSIAGGGGSINAGTGLYTAPASGAPLGVTLRVTDNAGVFDDAVVSVVSGGTLGIDPTSAVVEQGKSFTFSVYGGTAPYSYGLTGGTGARPSTTPA